MAWIVLFVTVTIALLYPSSVIAEDGSNLNPTPIGMLAIEAPGGIPTPSKEHKITPKVTQVAPKAPQVIQASVSAFTSDVAETDSTPNITASGTHVHSGTAACPIRYPFGTRIKVNGKQYVCEDRMNARYRNGNYFDLWMASRADAIHWGRRTVAVEVLP